MCVIDWTAAGTWALVLVGSVAAFFAYKTADAAIRTLGLNRASTEVDVFIKACESIDDEAVFGVNYQLVRDNASMLAHATLSDNGASLLTKDTYDIRLPNAVQDVLSALEKVGIIFQYATNKEMIEEYIGDVVINAYEALSNVIAGERKHDSEMYLRFEQMYRFCKERWNPQAAARVRYTNVRDV
jgi:hypothetical protein